MRRRLDRKGSSYPGRRSGLSCSLLLSLFVAINGLFAAVFYAQLTRDLPSVEVLPALLQPPLGQNLEPTRLYDRSGRHILLTLQNPAAAESHYLPVERSSTPAEGSQDAFASTLISATLATSDPGFWSHTGYTLAGLTTGGHPTLAQRLASDLLLEDESPGIRRSLRERFLAAQMTTRYGRTQVLEWYLNSAYYGRQVYGADGAARAYLNHSASDLSLAQAALLAAVAEAPALNPHDALQASLERQQLVLDQMLKQGWITPGQAESARQETLAFRSAEPLDRSLAPAFTRLALEQLSKTIPRARLERGGMRVLTTLDYDLQQQADCAAVVQLARLRDPHTDNRSASTLSGTPCEASRLLPAIVMAGNSPASFGALYAGVMVQDPQSGQILALVGDTQPNIDPGRKPGFQAGSLLTPFVYLAAFTHGMGPASLMWDVPLIVSPADTGQMIATTMPVEYSPSIENFNGKFQGPVSLRTALANDYRVPVVSVLQTVGVENVRRTFQSLGLRWQNSEVAPGSGASDLLPWEETYLTLVDASQAYSTLANSGVQVGMVVDSKENTQAGDPNALEPYTILKVEDTAGRLVWESGLPQQKPVLTPQLAYLTTNILADEAARWSSLGHPNTLEVGFPAAAKLGQTLDGLDTWAAGYTQQRTVTAWIGLRPYEVQPEAGLEARLDPRAAAGLWRAILQYASRGLPVRDWPAPPGISRITVCDPSGQLPTSVCPKTVGEVFLAGSEPTQYDSLYQAVQVNRETGRLATVFTPPELIDEIVYLSIPPQAQEWSRQAGLSTPPEDYDVLQLSEAGSPDVSLSAPPMFANVRGEVTLKGSAAGEGFAFYRIQVGQGLNPSSWMQVGEEATLPRTNSTLAVWNTAGLNGLYAIQLQVVRKDRQMETSTLQVTVDNTPPAVDILYPLENESLSGKTITFLAEATDDLALADVIFYLDGKPLHTLNTPPYALPWTAKPGAHTLVVRAVDQAGNPVEAEVKFEVRQ